MLEQEKAYIIACQLRMLDLEKIEHKCTQKDGRAK